MNRLISVEVLRFTSRRAVRVSALLALLAVVAAGAITFAVSNRDIAGASERAQVAATKDHQACLRGEFAPPPEEQPPGFDPVKECQQPDLAQVRADPRFHLSALKDVLGAAGAVLILIGLALGASFIGAEWHHRTMTTLLTWEPRRVRLWLAKMAAAAAVTFVGVLAVEALLAGALIPAAAFRGTTQGTTASWLSGVLGVALRGSALAGMAAVLGGAVATIARNTAVAVGISFAWLAVVENIVRGVRPRWGLWLIADNAGSFVFPGEGAVRTALGAGVVLAIYVVVGAVIAVAWFRRGDVA